MNDQVDFAALVNRAMSTPGLANMRPVVEKELLHYDILFSLDSEGLLDQLISMLKFVVLVYTINLKPPD